MFGTNRVQADEVNLFEQPNPENAQILVTEESVKNVFTISAENQELIAQAVQMDTNNEEYINSIIDSYNVEVGSTEENYNSMIEETVVNLLSSDSHYFKDTNSANLEDESSVNKKQGRMDPITAARLAYTAGVLIVSKKPAPMTASYMNHVIVAAPWSANPPNKVHTNDAWAK